MDCDSSCLNRRQFVRRAGALAAAMVGSNALASCSPPFAPPRKVYRIGWLSPSGRDSVGAQPFLLAMRERGYVEGQNLSIAWRGADGRTEPLAEMATELVQLPVDVIVTTSTQTARAAKEATQVVPIVFVDVGDSVATGLVSSIARPGGNATGLSNLAPGLASKRLELLKETAPNASRVAVLWNPANPANDVSWRELQGSAPALGVELVSAEVRGADDFDGVFELVVGARAEALFLLTDPLLSSARRPRIPEFAARQRLPMMGGARSDVAAGALMSYGRNSPALFERGAAYVDRILKGANPADLPVEQPMRFDLIVNLKTARELGITFPPSVRALVTEEIE